MRVRIEVPEFLVSYQVGLLQPLKAAMVAFGVDGEGVGNVVAIPSR